MTKLWIPRLLGAVFVFAAVSARADDNDIGKIWRNNNAVRMQAQEKKTESFDEFAQLLAKEPFNPVFEFNMGTGFLSIGDVEKARKILKKQVEIQGLDPQIAFFANYNLGVLAGAEQNIDEALKYYQKALEYVPDSLEVKTNIELLIQNGQGQKNQKQQGKGKSKDDQKQSGDPQDQDKKDGEEEEPEPQEFTNKEQKGKPKPKMSPEDVKKILEELKKQEQRIRAKHDRKGKKEKTRDKNW